MHPCWLRKSFLPNAPELLCAVCWPHDLYKDVLLATRRLQFKQFNNTYLAEPVAPTLSRNELFTALPIICTM